MKVSGILAILFATALLGAQTPTPKPTDTPKIPAEVLKQFYAADAAQQRALREQDQARIDVANANESWKQVVDAMQKVCGDKFQLKQDTVGADPYCTPVPPAPAKK